MLVSVYQWLKQAYGFREEKVKPYGFNQAPSSPTRGRLSRLFDL